MRTLEQRTRRIGISASAAAVAIGLLAAAWVCVPSASGLADKPELPSDLARVPSDAVVILSARVSELFEHPALKKLQNLKAQPGFDPLAEGEKYLGVKLRDIERLTLYLRALPSNDQPTLVISTVAPFDQKKVLAALGKNAKTDKRGGKTIHSDAASRKAIYLVDDHVFAVGFLGDIESLVDRNTAATSEPTSVALNAAAQKHTVVFGLNLAKVKEHLGEGLPPAMEFLKPLLQGREAIMTVDVSESAKADLQVTYSDEASTEEGKKALASGLQAAIGALKQQIGSLKQESGRAAEAQLLDNVVRALADTKIASDGSRLSGKLSLRVSNDQVSAGLDAMLARLRELSRRAQGTNNLKQIALAMHNYLDVNRSFPPVAICDPDGKPLLSWRVLLLPYLEEGVLAKEFHLDEPWDSAHNKKLVSRMPKVFAVEGAGAKEGETFYQGFSGDGAFFEGKKGRRITDITDGTSNTFLVAEANRAVPWTKPEDISYDASKPLPKLGFRKDGFFAAFCDGSVRFIPKKTPEATLRAYITPNGGEVISEN
jgi:hypothetical protein